MSTRTVCEQMYGILLALAYDCPRRALEIREDWQREASLDYHKLPGHMVVEGHGLICTEAQYFRALDDVQERLVEDLDTANEEDL